MKYAMQSLLGIIVLVVLAVACVTYWPDDGDKSCPRSPGTDICDQYEP